MMRTRSGKTFLRFTAVGALLVSSICAAQPHTLARFPNTYGKRTVFEARGNLWISTEGDESATQLTRGSFSDTMPRFSPDGRWIAFSRIEHTTEDVYVVPVAGGEPRRLTYRSTMPGGPGPTFTADDNVVVTWTPDSQNIVFLSRRASFN